MSRPQDVGPAPHIADANIDHWLHEYVKETSDENIWNFQEYQELKGKDVICGKGLLGLHALIIPFLMMNPSARFKPTDIFNGVIRLVRNASSTYPERDLNLGGYDLTELATYVYKRMYVIMGHIRRLTVPDKWLEATNKLKLPEEKAQLLEYRQLLAAGIECKDDDGDSNSDTSIECPDTVKLDSFGLPDFSDDEEDDAVSEGKKKRRLCAQLSACSLHDEPSPRTPCPRSPAVDEFGLPEIPGESCSASSVKLPREKLEAQAKSTASTALPGGQRELKAIAKKPAHADIAEDNLALSTKSFGLVKVAGGSKRS